MTDYAGGDENALRILVERWERQVFAFLVRMLGSPEEAEDLCQEVYFKLWENLHRYNAGSNFMAWAWRVAKNLIIDSYRRSRREREAAWLDPEIIDHLPSSDDPAEQTERRQRLRLVATSLRQISEDLAILVLMRDFAGLSYQEIAEATELPLGTVKSRLNRARLELATAVRRRVQIRAVPPQGGLVEGSA